MPSHDPGRKRGSWRAQRPNAAKRAAKRAALRRDAANTEKEEFDLHTLEQRSPFDESGGSINNKLDKMAATLWTSDLKPLIPWSVPSSRSSASYQNAYRISRHCTLASDIDATAAREDAQEGMRGKVRLASQRVPTGFAKLTLTGAGRKHPTQHAPKASPAGRSPASVCI